MLTQACDGHLLHIFSAQSMAFTKSFHFQVNQLMFGEGTRERKKKKTPLFKMCIEFWNRMSQFGSWVCLGPKHLHRLRNIHVSTGQVEVRDEMGEQDGPGGGDRGFASEVCSRFASSLRHSVHSGQDSLVRSLASQLCGICAMGIALIKCTSCLSH